MHKEQLLFLYTLIKRVSLTNIRIRCIMYEVFFDVN